MDSSDQNATEICQADVRKTIPISCNSGANYERSIGPPEAPRIIDPWLVAVISHTQGFDFEILNLPKPDHAAQ